MAVFNNRIGDQVFTGVNGEYNQVDYTGSLSDFRIYRNADGSVTVEHPTFGTDILNNIDGFWFGGEASWYSIEDAVALTPGANDGGVTFQNGVYTGDDADNIITGTAENNLFYGGRGDDVINGNGGDYNQGEYDGALSDYNFVRNDDGSVTAEHPIWGTDRLIDIDGIWFMGEARWYSIADAIAATGGSETSINEWGVLVGTNGNDTLRDTAAVNALYGGEGNDSLIGLANNYSQAEYDGAASDYVFTQNENGSVRVVSDNYGVDTLTNIDGVWFMGEARWYALDDLIEAGPREETGTLIDGVITGSNAVDDYLVGNNANNVFYAGMGEDTIEGNGGNDDILRIDGDIIEWTFTLQDNGTLIMTHPTWGENTVTGVEVLFSLRAGQSYTIDEALQLTDQLPEFRLDADNVLNGTNGDDNMIGSNAGTNFYGGLGDDFYMGSMNNYDQINYDGNRSEYTFTQNGDGTITADHPIWGTDTFADIEGMYFNGTGESGEFILVADLFA